MSYAAQRDFSDYYNQNVVYLGPIHEATVTAYWVKSAGGFCFDARTAHYTAMHHERLNARRALRLQRSLERARARGLR